MSRKFSFWIIGLLLLWAVPATATMDYIFDSDTAQPATVKHTATDDYLEQPIQPTPLDRATWQKKRQEMQFDEKPAKPKEQPKDKPASVEDESRSILGLGMLGQVLLIATVLLLLALVVFLLTQQGWLVSNPRLANNKDASLLLNDIEENLHETDLERALRLALEANDYRMAIRIYYLSIIKELSALQWIQWKRDKTNGQYVREMGDRPNSEAFRSLTIAFDRVWYGDENIGQRHYEALGPQFKTFINNLKKR